MKDSNKDLTYEEWREKLIENMTQQSNKERTLRTIKLYEEDLPKFYEEGWTIGSCTVGMLSRFI